MRSLSLLTALLLSVAPAQPAPKAPISIPRPSAERLLLERILTSNGNGASVDIFLGELPARFPITLPEGSRVIGSVVTVRPGTMASPTTAVYWNSPLNPLSTQQAIVRTLEQGGWRRLPVPFGPDLTMGGFQPANQVTGGTWYRRSPDQILIFRVQQAGEAAQATLTLSGAESLDQQLRAAGAVMAGTGTGLPVLRPPLGAEVHVEGQGSVGDDLNQAARIVTNLSPAALTSHYAGQLKQAGWRLLNEAEVDGLRTSIWSFAQGTRQNLGIFTVQTVGKGEYRAQVSTVTGR